MGNEALRHERIWLEPDESAMSETGRLWCQDNVWGDGATEYVRADVAAAALKAAEEGLAISVSQTRYLMKDQEKKVEIISVLEASLAAVYDECESVAVPAKATPYEQIEAYREAIRLLKARAGLGKDVAAPGVRAGPGTSDVQAGDIGSD